MAMASAAERSAAIWPVLEPEFILLRLERIR